MISLSKIEENYGNSTHGQGTIEIPVTVAVLDRVEHNGLQIAVGVIDAGTLCDLARVDTDSYSCGSGYQRVPGKSRITKIGKGIVGGKFDVFPTSLLVNLRGYVEEKHLLVTEGGQTMLVLSLEDVLWLVDGQHRYYGLEYAIAQDPERFRDFKVPFVCGLGWTPIKELEVFYVVNSNAKSVTTNTAYNLLARMSDTMPGVLDDLVGQGKAWQVKGYDLAGEMANETGIWSDKIRFSNQPAGITTIQANGFAQSCKELWASAYFSRLSGGAQVKVLEAYWEGVKLVLPECFENPQEYILQARIGVNALHGIFTDVIELVRDGGGDVTSPEAYQQVLQKPLIELTATNSDPDDPEEVSGAAFWPRGSAGAASGFSSGGGIKVLTATLKRLLPRIEI